MSRKIIGPDIVTQRKTTQESNNLWNYVVKINSMLQKNDIRIDNTIDVEIAWIVEQHMINQIIETYENVGWTVTYIGITKRESPNVDSTMINFNPATGSPATGSPAG